MADPIDLLLGQMRRKRNDPHTLDRQRGALLNSTYYPAGPGAGGFNPVGAPAGAGGTGSTTTRTVTPDYNALFGADSIFNQLKRDTSAAGIADASQRDAFLARLIGQTGTPLNLDALAPQLRASFAGVDPTVIASGNQMAEQGNQAGTTLAARIKKAYEDSMRKGVNALAARGAHKSGELPAFLQDQELAFRQAQTDMALSFQDAWSEAQAAYARGEYERARALAAQADATARRLLEQYPATTETVAAPAPTQPEQPELRPSTQGDLLRALTFGRKRAAIDQLSGILD